MVDESKGFLRSSMILLVTSTIASGIHYLFQFGMGRFLGPAEYGVLAAFFSILYIMAAPVQAVQLTITKFVAEFKAKSEYGFIKRLLASSAKKIFLLSIALFFAFIILSRQISIFLNISEFVVTISFSFIFLGMFILPLVRGFLQGLQKFKALGINLILESIVKLGFASILVILLGFGVTGAVWATNVSIYVAFAIATILLFKFFRKYDAEQLSTEQKSAIYKYAVPMLISLLSITALYSIDVILVKHFFAPEEAGIYAAASLIAKIIFFGIMPICNVMFPKIAELKAKSQKYEGIFIKSILLVLGLSSMATAVYFAAPRLIDKILFGPEYAAATKLIGLFGIAISLLSLSYVFVNYFLAIGKTKFVNILPIFVFAETAIIWFWHNSLQQILISITAVMLSMLITLIIIYFATKNETVNNNSSI